MQTVDGITGDKVNLFRVNRSPGKADLRKFGWAMIGGFGVLGALFWLEAWWWTAGAGVPLYTWTGKIFQIVVLCLWGLGVLLWASSLAPYPVARAVYVGWMMMVVPIGITMSTIVMTLVFTIVLPIFSLIRFSDPLRKKLRKEGTYWEDAKPYEPTMERMMRPF
jgi:hypothetical protein